MRARSGTRACSIGRDPGGRCLSPSTIRPAITHFNSPVEVCLKGSGRVLYLDSNAMPRVPVELPCRAAMLHLRQRPERGRRGAGQRLAGGRISCPPIPRPPSPTLRGGKGWKAAALKSFPLAGEGFRMGGTRPLDSRVIIRIIRARTLNRKSTLAAPDRKPPHRLKGRDGSAPAEWTGESRGGNAAPGSPPLHGRNE